MSKKVRPLALKIVNELQLVLGSMELGDYDASLKSVDRAKQLWDQLRAEVLVVIGERNEDERQARKKPA
jgi:hypothetical protein